MPNHWMLVMLSPNRRNAPITATGSSMEPIIAARDAPVLGTPIRNVTVGITWPRQPRPKPHNRRAPVSASPAVRNTGG
ncbi:hypothetical protein D3C81_2100800 [compost metagenome]